MAMTGATCTFPYVNILNEQNFHKVQEGVFDVLKKTGVIVQSERMRKVLKSYGCRVDEGNNRVYFDREVVLQAFSTAPKGFEITAREAKHHVLLQPGKTTQFINACGTNIYYHREKESKVPTRKEFYDYMKLLDVLPNIDFHNCFPFFGFQKVPECMKLIESVAAKYRISTKAQIEGTVFDNYRFTTEMAKAVGADLCQIVNSAAPFMYFSETADQIFHYTGADLPFHFAAGPTRGLTAPMNAAGSVVTNNAECLAGLVMAQAVKPGARVWMNSMIMTPDMRTGKPAFGDIGNSYTDMLFNQYWRHYGIPSWSNAASWTSAKETDYQAGYEQVMALMAQIMSGATVISYQGGMYAELYASPLKAMIDDDVVGMAKRLMQGIDCSEESFCIDEIHEIGPMPGSYMETDGTLENWREECYIPTVSSREDFKEWKLHGHKNVLEIAEAKLDALMKRHKAAPLPKNVEDTLEDILNDARNYYRKQGLISDEEWELYQEDIHSDNYPYA